LYRLPLVLFYREGQSVRAVSESLGISEDAVKQRLARGREMLRERMEGVIGRVLERSVPGAVFTMTIAVAIGALTAPSAIAASAFATAGTATTTSSSIVTAMSTTKAALATAALITVACIPVGYHFASASVSQQLAEQGQTTTKGTVERAKPTFENSVLFAEWRALHDKFGTNARRCRCFTRRFKICPIRIGDGLLGRRKLPSGRESTARTDLRSFKRRNGTARKHRNSSGSGSL
jgi:hypothetical protein